MMKRQSLPLYFLLVFLLLLAVVNITPAQAGEPDDTIGPANPNHLICVERHTHFWVDLDSDAFDPYGIYNPDAEVDPDEIKEECEAVEAFYRIFDPTTDFTVEYVRQTRIEGYVFEFHRDPHGPGGWTAVRSRDVPVVASGPGFEIFWGSEKDGFYYFDNLGAGPITLNLRLPPDAHPINPDIIVMSTGFFDVWEVDLGFYRGDSPPEDIEALYLPLDHKRHALLPPDTVIEMDENGNITYMPYVGGILPQDQPIATIALAAVLLIILPTAGILKFRRRRVED